MPRKIPIPGVNEFWDVKPSDNAIAERKGFVSNWAICGGGTTCDLERLEKLFSPAFFSWGPFVEVDIAHQIYPTMIVFVVSKCVGKEVSLWKKIHGYDRVILADSYGVCQGMKVHKERLKQAEYNIRGHCPTLSRETRTYLTSLNGIWPALYPMAAVTITRIRVRGVDKFDEEMQVMKKIITTARPNLAGAVDWEFFETFVKFHIGGK